MEDGNGMEIRWVTDFHHTVICQELHHYVRINKDIVVQRKQIVSIAKLQPQFQNPLKQPSQNLYTELTVHCVSFTHNAGALNLDVASKLWENVCTLINMMEV